MKLGGVMTIAPGFAGAAPLRQRISHARSDIGHEGNSRDHGICRSLAEITQPSGRGQPMTSPLEFSSRAALCRQLAKLEPANGVLWMAEAEKWSRRSKEKLCGGARTQLGFGILASFRVRSAEPLVDSCVSKSSR